MKIHITWAISQNLFLIEASKRVITSAINQNLDAYFSIFVPEGHDIGDYLFNKKNVEIIFYKKDNNFNNPWEVVPKWNVIPKADIVLGIDADVLIINKKNILHWANKSLKNKAVVGTIAHLNPFKSDKSWLDLFEKYNMSDNFSYKYNDDSGFCPFYINNGAVLIPAEILDTFRKSLNKWIKELNATDIKNNFYIAQIATTLAIKESKINHIEAPKTFNYLEVFNTEKDEKNISIFHYHMSKEYFKIKTIDLNKIKINLSKNILSRFYLNRIY
jgi:hypothetical protein